DDLAVGGRPIDRLHRLDGSPIDEERRLPRAVGVMDPEIEAAHADAEQVGPRELHRRAATFVVARAVRAAVTEDGAYRAAFEQVGKRHLDVGEARPAGALGDAVAQR